MTDASVIVRKQGKAGRLTLNRPKALHALNLEMCEILTSALLEWRNDPSVELVIVDHADDTRGFCAGGDVKLLADSGAKDGVEGAQFFATEYRLNTLIKEYPKPYVAVIDGITMGGGVGISVHGTHRIATERTTFAMPETGIGLIPDVGGGFFLSRMRDHVGMWLALTGDRLKGADVLAAGVATHLVSSDELGKLKSLLADDGLSALDGTTTEAVGTFAEHTDEIGRIFAADTVEDILVQLENGSDWAKGKAELLKTKSPLSMKATQRQLSEGATVDFRKVMQMEYRICSRIIKTKNFQEGVRAVLIDKDNSPNWEPADLSSVADDMLDEFFSPLGSEELGFQEIEQ